MAQTIVRLVCGAMLFGAPLALAAASPPPAIVGYVFPQATVLAPGQIAARQLTRINYAFANIANGRMVEGFPEDTQNLATLVALKRENPGLAILASVGGWSWSGHFSDVALTAQSRAIFIDSVVAFLARHSLDGLDVDWEYPGQPGAGNRFRAEDKQNYTLLLKELRARLDAEGALHHRHLFLTVAAAASSEFLDHTEMGAVARSVDAVNLMAYDYYEPSDDRRTGNHAPLYTDPADPKHISADNSVHLFEQAGVPADKLVLGVPFYGHAWSGVPAAHHGLFEPGKPAPELTYSQIVSTMSDPGYTRYWDQAASAPYLYNSATKLFITYEDQQSLARKCSYVLEHHLAGIMFWEYSDDPGGTLLNSIDKAFGSAGRMNR